MSPILGGIFILRSTFIEIRAAEGGNQFAQIVFLEEADAGYTRCAAGQALRKVLRGDPAERKYRSPRRGGQRTGAGFTQAMESGFGAGLDFLHLPPGFAGRSMIFKDWAEDNEICALRFRQAHFFRRMTGNRNESTLHARLREQIAGVCSRDIAGAQVHAIGAHGQGNVAARIDQDAGTLCARTPARSFDPPHCVASQRFQFARRKIFFSQLNVINAGTRGLRNFFQQALASRALIAGKLGAVGNVIQEQGQSPGINLLRGSRITVFP